MLATETYTDLCMTCNDQAICISDSRRPVMFCEQFDDYTPEPEKTYQSKSPAVSDKVDKADKDDYPYLGLCMNCDHRKTCPLAKSEGGVWHCEDYR